MPTIAVEAAVAARKWRRVSLRVGMALHSLCIGAKAPLLLLVIDGAVETTCAFSVRYAELTLSPPVLSAAFDAAARNMQDRIRFARPTLRATVEPSSRA